MTNFIQKTHLDIGFSDFNCLLDSQCSLLTSQILGRCIKLKWSNRAYAVYWLCGTLLCPWAYGEPQLKYHREVIKALVVLYQKVINSASCGKWPLRAVDN